MRLLTSMSRTATNSTPPPEPETPVSPLRVPVFRAIWLSSAVSNLGSLIQSVGAAWLMTAISDSADMVALVQASVTFPIMILALLAGAIADSLDRRRIMLTAQLFMFAASAALSICAWKGWLTPWLLLAFTFLIGCGTALNAPAWQASVGDMVPRSQIAGAVALNGMSFSVARSVGPAIGGALVAAAGASATFAANTGSYVALIWVLWRWRPPKQQHALPREPLAVAIAAGVRYVAMSPAIYTVLLRGVIFGMGASAVSSLMPLVAKVLLRGGPLTYGILLGAFGVGAVAGGLSMGRLRRVLTTENIVRGSCFVFALTVAAVGLSRSLLPTVLALIVGGAAWVMILSMFNVAVQLSAPRWVVARALSIYQMFTFGSMAGGSWLWGSLAESRSISFSLLASAIVLVACAGVGLVRPLAQAEELNLAPIRNWTEPTTTVPIEPRMGPIVVSVEYTIRERDVREFLAAMQERRRIRRRDGAGNWMLLQDLAEPELWIERFTTPTWLDYIRHSNRLTHEDAPIPQRLLALHRGPDKPRIRRMVERPTDRLPRGMEDDAEETPESITSDSTYSS